jgi:hypothetical protein
MEKIIIQMPYLDKITISQKIRPKYYLKSKYKPFNINGKSLPKKYNNNNYTFNNQGILINVLTEEKIISNPIIVGKERYWVINFQSIYNGYIKPIQRSNYMNIIKAHLDDWINIEPITEFPLRLQLFIYSNEMPVDIDNKGPIYFKVFTDLLVKKNIIPDDSVEYIRASGGTEWIPTPRHKEKMEFHISKIVYNE